MASELASSAILEAVKHRANHKPIIFCSLSLVAVGILMAIAGFVALIVDHAELGPPVYDAQYERYQGSSLANILGIMFIGFGSLIIMGNFCMLAYATKAYYSASEPQQQTDTGRTAGRKMQQTPSAHRQNTSRQTGIMMI